MKQTILCALALTLAITFAAVSQTPAAPKHRVVFQLTEPEGAAWEMLIGHVINMRTAFAKDGSEVEVVSGLTGDEQIIVNPPDSLVAGEEVRIAQPKNNGNGSQGKEQGAAQ